MTRFKWIALVAVLVAVAAIVAACIPQQQGELSVQMMDRGKLLCAQQDGNCVEAWNSMDLRVYSDSGSTSIFHLDGNPGVMRLAVPTAVGTATPGVQIDSSGVGNSLEIRKASTPVFYVDVDGNVTYTGFTSAGGLTSAAAGIAAPTAVGTATPAFYVDSLGVSNLFEVRDAATPVAAVNNGGNWIFGAADGTGVDVTWYSDTAGDYMKWDESDEVLNIIGTNAATALNVSDGNVVINDNLTVTAGAFDVTAGATTLEALTVGVAGTGADVQFFSDTSGDHFLWDTSEEALTIIGTNGQDALNIDDGNVDIADNVDIDGTLDVAGAVALASDVTLSAPSTGNNAGARVEYIGLPRIKLIGLDQGTNPGSQTIAIFDETPMGECAEVDAGTNVAITADTSYFRDTTNSIKLAVTTPADNDGWDCTISEVNLTDMESLGFWIYSDEAISSGDLDVTLDDTDGTDQAYDVGDVVANTWTYVELDINACDANCNTVDGIHFLLTAQGAGALTSPDIYVDAMYVWDDADEDALGTAILQDGVLGVVDTENGDNLVEWTDYIVHYESGNDFIVWIGDESASDIVVMAAY